MEKKKRWITGQRIVCILLTVGLMALVVWFSSQSGGSSNGLSRKIVEMVAGWFGVSLGPDQMEFWNLMIRKAAHFTLYFWMGVGAAGVLLTMRLKKRWQFLLAVAVCAVFAASDEMHQWIADAARHGSAWDVVLDTVGSGCGAGSLFGIVFYQKKLSEKNQDLKENGNGCS